jgi:hypothetical protein
MPKKNEYLPKKGRDRSAKKKSYKNASKSFENKMPCEKEIE